MRSGVGRAQARLTAGEQLAKAMMRRRACKSGFKFDQPKKKQNGHFFTQLSVPVQCTMSRLEMTSRSRWVRSTDDC